jgi:hypothetical protein
MTSRPEKSIKSCEYRPFGPVMQAARRNIVLTFRAKNARLSVPSKPPAEASRARDVSGTGGMQRIWHSVVEAAKPVRGRLAARWAAFDGRALGAAIQAGLAFRLRVADALLRMFAREFHAVLLRVTAYGCALAAMGLVVAEVMTRGHVAAETADTEWVEVNKPFPAFALAIPEFHESHYTIWRHANGGGRKDVMTFGDLGSARATAVVELYRAGGEPEVGDTDVTASIGELRLSTRPALPGTIDTKFGEVAVAPFTDRAPSGARQCLRFFRAFEEPRFELSGWFCNAGDELVDRRMIACAIDRLSLVAAGGEPKLGALFARAELKRTFCGQQSVFLAATPKRNDWIEAARDPRLRGRK